MAFLVQLSQPYQVEVRDFGSQPGRGEVRVRTLYSGISAGTELATYRGTNPYLRSGGIPRLDCSCRRGRPSLSGRRLGLLRGRVWSSPRRRGHRLVVGDVVWGIWGHRSHAVLPAERFAASAAGRAGPDRRHVRPGRRRGAQRRAGRRERRRRDGGGLRPGGDRAARHPAAGQLRARGGRRRHGAGSGWSWPRVRRYAVVPRRGRLAWPCASTPAAAARTG